jgi:hypothetical protein
VANLLAKCAHSLEGTLGRREIVLIGGHDFGGRDYFLFLTAEKLGKDLRRGLVGGRRGLCRG